ncbi:endopeptidase La [candidate division WOR-1 bacterium RIFOXYB2_FULL_37_13]|uniref:Lon protease n=1 Tax=candidate division WOR-1 bacterium RIFOXYB2_FULL_37_13 TaxID=1802579 RepID=A0A1F4SXI9_UNCSA|nr:MAG: endopeptidase La [candidate division WOR-1 bacterium RIFOXYB2_FULL_37_13]
MTSGKKINKEKPDKTAEWKEELPLIPIRNIVVFPQMIVPLFIGRSKSIKALEETLKKEKIVVFASQKNEEVEDPSPKDLCVIGTLAEVVQLLELPDGTTKVLVEGISRIKIENFTQESPYYKVIVTRIAEPDGLTPEAEAFVRNTIKLFEKYVKLNKRIPPETLMSIINVDRPGRLADLIASYITLKVDEKQAILETISVENRLKKLCQILEKELEVLEVEKNLQGKVRKQIEKVQKEYYLKEKLKAIKEELGEEADDEEGDISVGPEIDEYKKKIAKAKLPANVKEKAKKELDRLEKMTPMSAEATVIRTYLDWLIDLPWNKKSKSKIDIQEVEEKLNKDHYGLKKVKERIIEYFAVLKLTGQIGGSILCLVGPPGVGKTSIASSIAEAMGRKFVHVSLGGIRDEAEIRGHRRTYVGALPGRIIQNINKGKVANPVFLMDEVDKMGMDFKGDPAAALLEVLDPAQNKEFVDHYIDLPFDLSDVFFITTANTIDPIPRPLHDRMEIITMSGYTEEEKLHIAKEYLLPRGIQKHGLKESQVKIEDESLLEMIQSYTREAGVRNLERTIATVLRKIATQLIKTKEEDKVFVVNKNNVIEYLGAPRYHYGLAEKEDQMGVTTGLAWTEVGGDTLPIEVTTMKGRGTLTITGHLGEVMQESAKAAMSYVRSKCDELGIDENFYRKLDLHIHVPEGAVPKDGPSAGIAMATALVSSLCEIPARKDIAMTGEITLRGKVLPIGGLKEKLLAARRAGIKTVIIPFENEKDLNEIKEELPSDMEFILAKETDEVLRKALTKDPFVYRKPIQIQKEEIKESPADSIDGQMFA